MIILVHNKQKVIGVFDKNFQNKQQSISENFSEALFQLAKLHPGEVVIWCEEKYFAQIAFEQILTLFHHDKMMLSFAISRDYYFSDLLEYIDQSPFARISHSSRSATWIMSADIGLVHASVLNVLSPSDFFHRDANYFLSSLAKMLMPLGLMCYSEPALCQVVLKNNAEIVKASLFQHAKFIAQHYRHRWLLLFTLNLFIYDKIFSLLPIIASLVYRQKRINSNLLDCIVLEKSKVLLSSKTIDVLIPTLGRKDYLFAFLIDLSEQTLLPKNVIIIEQPIDGQLESQLPFLVSQKWPFVIKHAFINQRGVCNARNLGLSMVSSDWVFFGDDDIRVENDFLEGILQKSLDFSNGVITASCLQVREQQKLRTTAQWPTFGAGCSLVKANLLVGLKFNMGYEFGYGEDDDFGLQLRSKGLDVLYVPNPSILHLKAPIGGFRCKPVLAWSKDLIQPKPSPTILLKFLLHNSEKQLLGYKTILFLKLMLKNKSFNSHKFFKLFVLQWNQSMLWAKKLKVQTSY